MPKPLTSEQALRRAVARLGEIRKQIAAAEDERDVQLAAVKAACDVVTSKSRQKAEALETQIADYCEAHRTELLSEGKSRDLGSGTVGWRTKPVRVVIEEAAQVVSALRALGMERLVRVKESPDLQAIKRARGEVEGRVAGIVFEQEEEFFVKPL